MMDFIMGWILGKNVEKDLSPVIDTTHASAIEVEPIKEVPKTIKYVHIPEISGFDATLEACYSDYENTNLVTIVANGNIEYYLEVEVPATDTKWGDQDLRDFI